MQAEHQLRHITHGKMCSVMWVNTVWMLHTTFTDDPNTEELKKKSGTSYA